jgi:hypothetical protein
MAKKVSKKKKSSTVSKTNKKTKVSKKKVTSANVIVTLQEGVNSSKVLRDLKKQGFILSTRLENLNILTGTLPESNIDKAKEIKGLADLRLDTVHQYLNPPSSEIQ